MKIIETLERIESASGSLAKTKILEEGLKDEDLKVNFEAVLRIIYSSTNFNFGARTIEKIFCITKKTHRYEDAGKLAEEFTINGDEINAIQIINICSDCETKTGNDLLNYLKSVLQLYNGKSNKWLIRILLHNLRVGISAKSVNKVFNKIGINEIEKFSVQLCGVFKSVDDVDWSYPFYAGIKYDGMRAICKKVGNVVTFTSRQGENITYVPELIEEALSYNEDFELDGEIDCSNFGLLQSRIGKKLENIEELKELHFRIYDILSLNGIDITNRTQQKRYEYLNSVITETNRFKIEKKIIVEDEKQLKEYYDLAIANGEEGLILKKPLAIYENDSRKQWMKMKPRYELTLEVIDYDYGSGKNSKNISRLYVSDSSKKCKSWIGCGLTNENITTLNMLHNNDSLKGIFVDVIFQEASETSKGLSLRFGRFSKFRTDKTEADNINNYKDYIHI